MTLGTRLNEYRLTRNKLYSDAEDGKNLSIRQGHYIIAESAEAAIKVLDRRYPYDNKDFTVQLWREHVNEHHTFITADQ